MIRLFPTIKLPKRIGEWTKEENTSVMLAKGPPMIKLEM